MIYPIIAFGDPVLKKKAKDISPDYPDLKDLIDAMYATMHNAQGVGLAAPQIGLDIRLFVTDGAAFEDPEAKEFRQIFINPVMVEETGDEWSYNEGCLSIPDIREEVIRKKICKIKYFDENFTLHEKEYKGIPARIIQHEYDHIEGILFTDRISGLRKRLLKKRLIDIAKGQVDVNYKMKFPLKK